MAWWIWLIAGFAIGIVELMSVTFVLLWFAIAAIVTSILTPVIHVLWAQLLVFGVISVGLYLVTRPLARKWRSTRTYSSHLETREGKTGVVVSGAEPGAYVTVRIEGELWSATSRSPLQAGQAVVVRDAEGAVLTVEPAEQAENAARSKQARQGAEADHSPAQDDKEADPR